MRVAAGVDAITDSIFIGNYLDAQDLDGLSRHGIKSILSLNGERYELAYGEVGIVKAKVFNLLDGAGNDPAIFLRAVDTLAHFRRVAAPVLVHCHAGQSRSAVVVAVHFMRDEGMDLAEAMERISAKRSVRVTAGLQEALAFHLA